MKSDVDGVVENVLEPVRTKTDKGIVVKSNGTQRLQIFKGVVVDVKQKIGRNVDRFKTVEIAERVLGNRLQAIVVNVEATEIFWAPFENIVLDETGIIFR